jgi:secreted trypsin-like serine protease
LNKKPADKNEWPWLAALLKPSSTSNIYGQHCGASLISSTHVLTTAICIERLQQNQIRVRLGEYKFGDTDGDEDTFNLAWMKMHENFNYETVENNIAILKLDRKVTFSDSIKAATLPFDIDHSQDGNFLATALGWGSLYYGERDRELKFKDRPTMEVEVYVWNNTHCANNYGKKGGLISDTQICAGFDSDGKLGGDLCNGLQCLNYW